MENSDHPKRQPSTTSCRLSRKRIEELKEQREDRSQPMLARVVAHTTLMHFLMTETLLNNLPNPSPEKRKLS